MVVAGFEDDGGRLGEDDQPAYREGIEEGGPEDCWVGEKEEWPDCGGDPLVMGETAAVGLECLDVCFGRGFAVIFRIMLWGFGDAE